MRRVAHMNASAQMKASYECGMSPYTEQIDGQLLPHAESVTQLLFGAVGSTVELELEQALAPRGVISGHGMDVVGSTVAGQESDRCRGMQKTVKLTRASTTSVMIHNSQLVDDVDVLARFVEMAIAERERERTFAMAIARDSPLPADVLFLAQRTPCSPTANPTAPPSELASPAVVFADNDSKCISAAVAARVFLVGTELMEEKVGVAAAERHDNDAEIGTCSVESVQQELMAPTKLSEQTATGMQHERVSLKKAQDQVRALQASLDDAHRAHAACPAMIQDLRLQSMRYEEAAAEARRKLERDAPQISTDKDKGLASMRADVRAPDVHLLQQTEVRLTLLNRQLAQQLDECETALKKSEDDLRKSEENLKKNEGALAVRQQELETANTLTISLCAEQFCAHLCKSSELKAICVLMSTADAGSPARVPSTPANPTMTKVPATWPPKTCVLATQQALHTCERELELRRGADGTLASAVSSAAAQVYICTCVIYTYLCDICVTYDMRVL